MSPLTRRRKTLFIYLDARTVPRSALIDPPPRILIPLTGGAACLFHSRDESRFTLSPLVRLIRRSRTVATIIGARFYVGRFSGYRVFNEGQYNPDGRK